MAASHVIKNSPAVRELESNPGLRAEFEVLRRESRLQSNGIATMEDFWFAQGWYKIDKKTGDIRLTHAKWQGNPELQAEAIILMQRILGKDPRDLIVQDFTQNRLGGLIYNYFRASPYLAVQHAFPDLDIKPWEMSVAPQGLWKVADNRIAATKWLVEKLEKNPKNLSADDFTQNRLGGLLFEIYNGSIYAAVTEAFPELNIKGWEMAIAPQGFYLVKENRIEACEWLAKKLYYKPARDITRADFIANHLDGLIKYHNGSPFDALFEAGLVTREDEAYMRYSGHMNFASSLRQ